jgi:hypothetical protein
MANELSSLLAGRNAVPLNQQEILRAVNTFLGLDNQVNVKHEQGSQTAFHVRKSETAQDYGEIIFGADIYPGRSVVDPNSALSLDAAAAHELTHYYRWKYKNALEETWLMHVDEALTSLQAIFRYDRKLSETDVRQLVSDAMQRLQLFVREHAGTRRTKDESRVSDAHE